MTRVRFLQTRRKTRGFSLVEMLVAIAVGLVLITVMSVVYLNSKNSTKRQDQLSTLQQSVRTAFEYLSYDSRMVGHLGCFTRLETLIPISTLSLGNNFSVGIEGYEFTGTAVNGTYTLGGNAPDNITTPSSWTNSTGATFATVPLADISGGAGVGLTPGSDVLIVRSAAIARPVRLTAAVSSGNNLPIDNRSTGTCSDGSANLAGFCAGSFGVVASCSTAQVFQVQSLTGANLTLQGALTTGPIYAVNASEVFPMQTVVYYVKRSASQTTTSLYRRVLDGAMDDEQELIEGVENMQVRYGLDTTTPDPDGIIDGDYVAASSVPDWNRVVAVRISLLVRAANPVEGDLATTLPTSSRVNGVSIVFPTELPRFDRRVFTTTVALRNRIAYAAR